MDVKTLQQHLLALATLNETGAPVVSCYLNLERGPLGLPRCAGRPGGTVAEIASGTAAQPGGGGHGTD